MLLGIKSKKAIFFRHLFVGILSAALLYGFWLSRPEWSESMRFWRAVGDASFVLLFLALIIGPAAKIWNVFERFTSWRRELGIWFGLSALAHGILILDGWARWDAMRFLGYEFIPQLERYARLEPGFGLANLTGLLALFFTIILAATSSDRIVKFFGVSSWKWLHYLAYVIFYLVVLHVAYFMFMHFNPSFHRPSNYNPNWFQFPFLAMALAVFVLQVWAFIKTIVKNRKSDWY